MWLRYEVVGEPVEVPVEGLEHCVSSKGYRPSTKTLIGGRDESMAVTDQKGFSQ